MRSYTLKLFWWFWLTAAVAVVASHMIGKLAEEEQFRNRGETMREIAALYGEKASSTLARNGREAALDYIAGLQRTIRITGYLFDDDGKEMLGQPVPDYIHAILDEARKKNGPASTFERGRPVFAVPLESFPGHYFAGALPNLFREKSSAATLYRLLAAVFAAALLSWILAVRLTHPLKGLGKTMRKFAAGALDAREERAARRKDDIGTLARDFNAMAARIEELLKGQRRLLADVSHELRSPLTRLGVALELARRHIPEEATGEYERMENELARMNALIGSLLQLSRLDALDRPENRQTMDLSALVGEIAEDGDFEGAPHGRGVSADILTGVSYSGDPALLRSAVENLVRNALRYSPEGGTVDVSLSRQGGAVRILVEDRGPGVPDEELEHIFTPFHRVEQARERTLPDEGCGLGLAIAGRAASLHGGTVTARNRPEGGLAVEILLPEDRPEKD